MKSWLCAAAALGMSVAAAGGAARAEVETLAQAGNWKAFGGMSIPREGTNRKSTRLCGVSQGSAEERYLAIKAFEGDPSFTIQLTWKLWRIKDGDKQTVVLTMDGNSPWTTKQATGMHFDDGDAGLERQERVTAAGSLDHGNERRLRPTVQQACNEGVQLRRVERMQLDDRSMLLDFQLLNTPFKFGTVAVRGSASGDDQHRARPPKLARERQQQRDRVGVGEMEVFHHQDQKLPSNTSPKSG